MTRVCNIVSTTLLNTLHTDFAQGIAACADLPDMADHAATRQCAAMIGNASLAARKIMEVTPHALKRHDFRAFLLQAEAYLGAAYTAWRKVSEGYRYTYSDPQQFLPPTIIKAYAETIQTCIALGMPMNRRPHEATSPAHLLGIDMRDTLIAATKHGEKLDRADVGFKRDADPALLHLIHAADQTREQAHAALLMLPLARKPVAAAEFTPFTTDTSPYTPRRAANDEGTPRPLIALTSR